MERLECTEKDCSASLLLHSFFEYLSMKIVVLKKVAFQFAHFVVCDLFCVTGQKLFKVISALHGVVFPRQIQNGPFS